MSCILHSKCCSIFKNLSLSTIVLMLSPYDNFLSVSQQECLWQLMLLITSLA